MGRLSRNKFVLGSFALAWLINSSCTKNSAKENSDEHLQGKQSYLTVKTSKCVIKPFNYFINSTGKIKSFFEQKIVAPIDGQVNECVITNGSYAEQGQALVSYHTETINLNLKRAQANLYRSRLDFESNLVGYAPKRRTDSVLQFLRASSGLTQAEIEVEQAQLEISRATIRAPFAGRIANVKIQKGWNIKAGDELFTIYSEKDLYIEVKTLETDFQLLKIGDQAEVTPLSQMNTKYRAVVAEINPIVDENGMVAIKLKLIESHGLLPGMNSTVMIQIPNQQALTVPREAVVLRNGKSVVFTLESGLAKWNYVTTGRENNNEIEIRTGLSFGQKVIVSNNLQLGHDAAVKEE